MVYNFFWYPIVYPDKPQSAASLNLLEMQVPDVSYLPSMPCTTTPCLGFCSVDAANKVPKWPGPFSSTHRCISCFRLCNNEIPYARTIFSDRIALGWRGPTCAILAGKLQLFRSRLRSECSANGRNALKSSANTTSMNAATCKAKRASS